MYATVRRMFKDPKHLILWLFFSLHEVAVVLGNCSPDCMPCINDTCVTCELGTYLASGSCHLCPEHCTSCNNSVACNNCTEGYFGLSCAFNCPSFCVNNTCNKDSGVCTDGCIDGYFLSNSSCFQCHPNCKTCATSSSNCVQCREGDYGASCEYPCSRCKDGICSKENCTYGCGDGYFQANGGCHLCTIHCRSCSDTFDNCHSCEDGYFGQYCQLPCSGCIPCNQEDGSCHIDDTFLKSTDAPSEVTHVVYEENDAEYSLPNKTNRPTVVPMETRSTELLSNIPPRIPVKSYLYSDVI